MPRLITRRVFIGAAIGAGVFAGSVTRGAGATTRNLYRLNPHWGAGDPSCAAGAGHSNCSGCSACVKHATNKLFATVVAADWGRAHPGCKCKVELACAVDAATYNRLFAEAETVDRRTPGVDEQLVCAAVAPGGDPPTTTTTKPPVATSPGVGTGAGAAPAAAPTSLATTDPASGAAVGLTGASPNAFARTGGPFQSVALTGAAVAAAGVVLLRIRRRTPLTTEGVSRATSDDERGELSRPAADPNGFGLPDH